MQCPRDQNPLKLIEKYGRLGHHCQSCEGVFLPGRFVEAFKHNYQTDVLEKLQPLANQSIRLTNCPACHHGMQLVRLNGLELDLCSHCRGMWFDAEELQDIIDQWRAGDQLDRRTWLGNI